MSPSGSTPPSLSNSCTADFKSRKINVKPLLLSSVLPFVRSLRVFHPNQRKRISPRCAKVFLWFLSRCANSAARNLSGPSTPSHPTANTTPAHWTRSINHPAGKPVHQGSERGCALVQNRCLLRLNQHQIQHTRNPTPSFTPPGRRPQQKAPLPFILTLDVLLILFFFSLFFFCKG